MSANTNGQHEDPFLDYPSDISDEKPSKPAKAPKPAKPAAKPATAPSSDTDRFLLEMEATDYGNGLCVEHLFHNKFAFNESYGLLFFDGKRWNRENADAMLSEAIVATFKRRAHLAIDHDKDAIGKKSIRSNAAINATKARFLELPCLYVRIDDLDAQPHLLNCQNGIIDLKTGKLLPHDPAQFITHLIDVEYKPEANQDIWLNYLSQIIEKFSDETSGVADYVKMFFGYSTTGETREHAMLYMHGAKGRNGKGTLCDSLQAVMGSYATGCEFTTLTRKREGGDQGFDLAGLRGARMVFTSESGKESKLNEATVKALTGQDTIRAAFKGKDHFSFKPIFKIIANSNHDPKGDVEDNSFWGRIKQINFPTSFQGKEDKSLRGKLSTTAAKQGILAWLVEGAILWYATGDVGLIEPKTISDTVKSVRDSQDSIRAWINDDCVIDANSAFQASDFLFFAYESWCKSMERDDIKTKEYLSRRLSAMDFDRVIAGPTNARARGFKGIRSKTDEEREADQAPNTPVQWSFERVELPQAKQKLDS